MIKPKNDFFMVEVLGKAENPLGLVGGQNPEDGIREGMVVAISDVPIFFGANTYMFDKSLAEDELLAKIHTHYKEYVGKKVYWPERSESGAVVKYGDTTYAFIKWSSIMGVEE